MSEVTVLPYQLQTIEVDPDCGDVKVFSQTQIININPPNGPLSIINAGPQGPRGQAGPQGPAGDADNAYSLTFESPGTVTIWDIIHPFDNDPSVEVRDSTGRVCIAPVRFTPGVVHIDISPSNITLKAKLTP